MSYIWNNNSSIPNTLVTSQQPAYIMENNYGRKSMNYMSPSQSTANVAPGNQSYIHAVHQPNYYNEFAPGSTIVEQPERSMSPSRIRREQSARNPLLAGSQKFGYKSMGDQKQSCQSRNGSRKNFIQYDQNLNDVPLGYSQTYQPMYSPDGAILDCDSKIIVLIEYRFSKYQPTWSNKYFNFSTHIGRQT